MNQPDQIMASIAVAVELGRAGEREQARDELTALWARIGPAGDPFHRCVLAHYLADLQDSTADELAWDELALDAVTGLTDERARRHHADLRVRAFLPSLHLNLADGHRRLGHADQARAHLDAARGLAGELPDDPYAALIRDGIAGVAAALAAGSTDRLTGAA